MIREEIIAQKVKGKRVLDIGSVGQSDEYCLWGILSENSLELTGVDLPTSIDTLKSEFDVSPAGYSHGKDKRIVYGNMENIQLNRKFEVVVAGDVIEHVSNQGLFLDNIAHHLEPDGELILTTPNAKWLTVFFKPNATHTLWHDIYTLQTLLKRHKLSIKEWFYYYGNKKSYPWWQKPLVKRQSIFVVAQKEESL